VQQKRVAVFVEHVRRNGVGQTTIARIQRLDLERIVADAGSSRAGARVECALAAAFGDFSGVPLQAPCPFSKQRQRREHRVSVVRPPSTMSAPASSAAT